MDFSPPSDPDSLDDASERQAPRRRRLYSTGRGGGENAAPSWDEVSESSHATPKVSPLGLVCRGRGRPATVSPRVSPRREESNNAHDSFETGDTEWFDVRDDRSDTAVHEEDAKASEAAAARFRCEEPCFTSSSPWAQAPVCPPQGTVVGRRPLLPPPGRLLGESCRVVPPPPLPPGPMPAPIVCATPVVDPCLNGQPEPPPPGMMRCNARTAYSTHWTMSCFSCFLFVIFCYLYAGSGNPVRIPCGFVELEDYFYQVRSDSTHALSSPRAPLVPSRPPTMIFCSLNSGDLVAMLTITALLYRPFQDIWLPHHGD